MPIAAKKDLLPEIAPEEWQDDEWQEDGQDDDFGFGSFDDMAAMMVEALTIPLAADLVDRESSEAPEAIEARPLSSTARN
jgi:hypothetical protein